MLIQLTTPYNPGSLDPGMTYTHARLTNVSWQPEVERANMMFCFGTVTSEEGVNVFVPGRAARVGASIQNSQDGTEYNDFLTENISNSDETCIGAAERAILLWAKDNVEALAGIAV